MLGMTVLLVSVVDIDFAAIGTLLIVSLVLFSVFILKLISIKKPERIENNFTAILALYSVNTFLYLVFEPALIPWLVQFSFAVFIFEVVIYSYQQAPSNAQISILVLNFALLATWSVLPEVALGIVVLKPVIVGVMKFQIVALWIIGMTMLLSQLRKIRLLLNEKAEAEANTQWYSDLFSILSHNIRTPLTTIHNITQILTLKMSKTGPITISNELFNSLSESSGLSLKVVDEILKRDSVLKIQGGARSLTTFALAYENDHAPVQLTNAPWMETIALENKEQLALGLALDVFIDNSKRFGATEIHLYSPKKGILHIQDNGSGMNEEVLSYFGKPFNPHKSKNSSGLGTYFASELLTRSGWIMQALPSQQGALIEILKRSI